MLRVLFLLTVALVNELAWAERVEKLSTGWRFSHVSAAEGDFISPDYDDSAWTQVEVPHDWAIAAPFDAISHDGATGPNAKKGVGAEIVPELDFDGKTCPMCFLQGADDVYSPLGSVRLYERLREKGLAAELHLFADRWHGFHGDATIGDQGTAWDHWCDRMLTFIARLYSEVDAARWVWSLLPQLEADLNRLEAALPGPIYLAGTENPSQQSRLAEDWTREWIKGAQADLHLECVPMTTTQKASRIREYLNHCRIRRGECGAKRKDNGDASQYGAW